MKADTVTHVFIYAFLVINFNLPRESSWGLMSFAYAAVVDMPVRVFLHAKLLHARSNKEHADAQFRHRRERCASMN